MRNLGIRTRPPYSGTFWPKENLRNYLAKFLLAKYGGDNQRIHTNLRRLSTKQVTKARKLWTPTTPRGALRSVEIHFRGFHCGTSRVGRENPNNGRGRSLYQDGSFRSLARNGYSNRRSTSLYEGNMEDTWPTHRYRLG